MKKLITKFASKSRKKVADKFAGKAAGKNPAVPADKSALKSTEKSAGDLRPRSRGRRHDDLPDFRDMIENAVQGVLVHRNFKPLYANQACADLFGFKTPQDILDLPLIRPLVATDLWAKVESDNDDLVKGRKPSLTSRMRAHRKDGREIWLSMIQRVVDWHGSAAVQVMAYDISAQVEIEQTILKNEQRLSSILEILPYPIYVARRDDGQMLFVNRKSCLLFQGSASQLLRSSSLELYVDPKERDDLRKLLVTIPDIRDVEVKMKTAQGREFTAEMAAIAVDYLGTPAVLVALNDISQRKEMEAELFRQASTDALTGISNRRYFIGQAAQELRRSRRFARDMSVMMIDLDHFKQVNDQHGHAIGDAVLQGVVKRALESLRQSDLLGRLGGEEFAVIMPETDLAAATDAAERLRVHLEERPVIAACVALPSTVSIGVAQLSAKDTSIDALLHRADLALYAAKEKGRNRVEVAS
jgi:diguanylate cyclase (GGDEF)-like protein/PAS domain S-box-containing protein